MKSLNIKFIKICSILFITGIIASCGDDFLTPKPLSMFMPENTYTDKTAMISLLNECRHSLKTELVGSEHMLCLQYNKGTDICIYGAATSGDLDISMLPTSVNTSYWDLAWMVIKTANLVISRHDNATYDSEADKNEILSEAYFHRAYWYYCLVHLHGDVPFIDGEITRPTVDLYTTSRKSILNQMVTDMEFAVQHLPVSVKFGEVSRAAGNHLLTKLYLSVSRFNDAIRAATEVIERSGLALMKNRFGVKINPVYWGITYEGNVMFDLFRKENFSITENTEGILIAQDRVEFRDKGASSSASQRTRTWTPGWTELPGMIRSGAQYEYLYRGQAFVRPVPYWYHTIWKDCGDDLRHTWPNWFPMDSLKYNDPTQANYGQPAQKQMTLDSIRRWFPFQYYKLFVPDEIRDPKTNNDARGGYTDFYIFRLAETYLLRAEAYWWANLPENARNDINEVRERAHAPLISTADVTIDYILDERARELYAEESRRIELTRIAFIMANQERDGYSANNIHQRNFFYDRVLRCNVYYGQQILLTGFAHKMSPFHYLWPIPQTSIDTNVEGHINQNLGYYGSENNIKPLE